MRKTWTWSLSSYELAKTSDEQVIALCQIAGASGLEGNAERWAGVDAAGLERVRTMYRGAGLSIDSFHLPFTAEDDIASLYETARRAAVARMERSMETAAALGVRVVIQHPSTCRYAMEVEGLDRLLSQMARSMETLLKRAEGLGLVVALENMLPAPDGARLGSRPEHFAAFDSAFGCAALGFCLDTGHALVAAGPARAGGFFDAMTKRLAAFHIQDNSGDRDLHIAPGRGLVDWGAVFAGMARIGFAHPACIEAPPFAYGPHLTHSPAAWKQMLAEVEALANAALGACVRV
ncbi:MAG TPA: sugar phosphate isomerase/epimerase family protein [Candidatus Brocadiia bacterium]|nr:sugar phosphate isomerase/epimerase family protein [Candidatus Brocadiia bacterium]